ncbi:SAYSvFN domain-containing protein 1 [Choloepus didactylus]|uniref:SAYSvFN domain-containing protein 1 n=1 Tax=Choloepus didactylus TaxID=27675 RepID=UPI00189F297A|nr:SAYSvFN domain-containing protein 1 [Choloepus didactylus]
MTVRQSRGRCPAGARAPGCAGSKARAMEQRLAEFREARKRNGPAAEPSTSGYGAQTSDEKAEGTAISEAAPGWLKRFLLWQPRPANARAQPSPAQEAAQPGGSTSQPPQNVAIPPPPCWDQSFLTNVTFLKVLLWLVLLGLFVELEFGLAYFVLSLFYWMYVGTRGPEEKKEGEKSAYSVFNPGCEAIQGSLTAEQFERELQFRPLAGR